MMGRVLGQLALLAEVWALKAFGREWLHYITSNTMNAVTTRLAPFFWTYECQARVIGVRHETHDAITIELLPNQHFSQARAGQYIELVVVINGQVHSRCYSLSRLGRHGVAITVKRKQGGLVSSWLFDHARRGMVFSVSRPQGSFVYQGQQKLLMISAGSGITPCYALANEILAEAPSADVAMIAQFKTDADVIFSSGLQRLAQLCRVEIALSQSAGTVKQDVIACLEQSPELLGRDIYLCGPAGFMDKVVGYLTSKNYNLARLQVERFNFDGYALAGEQSLSEIYFQAHNATVHMTEADRGKTLLEIAEAHGIELEHGCRAGMCGSCKCHLVHGEVSGNQLGIAVYPCTAYPASTKLVIG